MRRNDVKVAAPVPFMIHESGMDLILRHTSFTIHRFQSRETQC